MPRLPGHGLEQALSSGGSGLPQQGSSRPEYAWRETHLGTVEIGTPQALPRGQVPALARDILRYFSLVGVPSLAPAVAMAKAEVADRALRVLSRSRQDVMTTPLL